MLICVMRFPVKLSEDCQISSVGNFLPRPFQVVEGVVGEVKIFSLVGTQIKN